MNQLNGIALMPRPDWRAILLFLALAYGLAWALAGGFYALGGRLSSPGAVGVLVLYMFTPAMAAVVVQRWVRREAVAGPLGIRFNPNRWWLVAWLLPAVLLFLTLGISALLPGVRVDLSMAAFIAQTLTALPPEQAAQAQPQLEALQPFLFWIGLLGGLAAGVTLNAVAAFGEELGWRGFLDRELRGLGFWRASAVIGLVWGLWHAPIILQGYNYPQHPVAGVGMMTLLTLLLTPPLLYVRWRARSVLAPAILHGTFNGVAGLATVTAVGGTDLLVGVTGLAGLLALVIVNLAVLRYDPRPSFDEE